MDSIAARVSQGAKISDDAKTSVERLVKVTGDAGFPSAARKP